MSTNVSHKHLTKSLRIPQIITGLKHGLNPNQIAAKCGVSEKTISRDIAEWKENGGFDQWLLSEFMRLHEQEIGKEEGNQAYRVIADLLKKRLKDQQEIAIDGGNSFTVKIVDNSQTPEKDADVSSAP